MHKDESCGGIACKWRTQVVNFAYSKSHDQHVDTQITTQASRVAGAAGPATINIGLHFYLT